MKRIIVAAAVACMLPIAAYADTPSITQLQAQVQSLLNQVTQLQAQAGGTGATTGTASATTAATSVSCPNVSRSLKKGMSGADVTRLQTFLAQDPSIYPEGQVTGYYGALTEAAVKRWQAANNIVSSGTAASTGYGVVGPRTAAAMALACSKGSAFNVQTVKTGGYMQVSPITGNAPLTTNVQINANTTNSCEAANYQLDWGDNSGALQLSVPAGSCSPVTQQTTHTYQIPGTYQIILSSGVHRTTAQVVVYGAATSSAQ